MLFGLAFLRGEENFHRQPRKGFFARALQRGFFFSSVYQYQVREAQHGKGGLENKYFILSGALEHYVLDTVETTKKYKTFPAFKELPA